MPVQLTLVLSPEQASDKKKYTAAAARVLNAKESRIAFIRVLRRSIDARKGHVRINLGLEVYLDDDRPAEPFRLEYGDVSHRPPVVIVGCGPAGLFAALKLIEGGYKPVIIERGREVSLRKRDIARINRNEKVDPDSNYCFGEGGAGTFSDGKLYTRSKKRGDYRRALEILHLHGADESILYDAHPHIGTDKLPQVITAIRETILNAGGEILFGRRMTGLIIQNRQAIGITTSADERIEGIATVLATGHSARDVYELLHRQEILLEAKPFAMGVRVEHPQALIDSIQYHRPYRGDYLPAASYSLASQAGQRGVYSFCMCPGGFIVPALTAEGECVVNGMSPSGRNAVFANAGIVTEVRQEDFEHLLPRYGALAGLKYQQQFERAAFEHGGRNQIAPAQRLVDFLSGSRSPSLPKTSYHPGVVSSVMNEWMPPVICRSLQAGLLDFGKKMKGFLTDEALLLGVESRTSSPVRIPRDAETCQHPQVAGLYPCGEGAGYAGGIISAAIDGENIAKAIIRDH